MIILGDTGINYYLDGRDRDLKNELSDLPITLLCIHGNHEARPWEAEGNYEEIIWHKGIVYAEEKLEAENWTVDIVLSHTVPIEAE